jgi:hypothetical protein
MLASQSPRCKPKEKESIKASIEKKSKFTLKRIGKITLRTF